jgi:uncharacterized membrane protein YbaN (DUF454 family)
MTLHMPAKPEPSAHDPAPQHRDAEGAAGAPTPTPAVTPAQPPSEAFAPRPLAAPWRWLLVLLACLSLATGVVGIFVPGLPTTVFVLIAAWAAARSSPRLHRWLLSHRVFGKLIADWQHGGCVSRRSKWNASAAMGLCTTLLLWMGQRWWVTALAIGCMACVLAWLWCRPEPAAR